MDALSRSAISLFEQYVNLSKKIPSEVITTVSGIEDCERLADTIASHMSLNLEQKQEVLEIADLTTRFDHLMGLMESEIDLFQVEHRIRGRVKKQMEKSQREYYLNEQIKAIQKELGDEEGVSEFEQLETKINESGMPKSALEKAKSEIAKLKMMSPMSAEASVLRNYIDWMIGVPWKARSRVKHDLKNAEKTLNDDHHGLEEVKERILEFLAVQKRVKTKGTRTLSCRLQGLVKPHWVSQLLKQQVANLSNESWVACAMRLRLEGIAEPISDLCPVKLFKN